MATTTVECGHFYLSFAQVERQGTQAAHRQEATARAAILGLRNDFHNIDTRLLRYRQGQVCDALQIRKISLRLMFSRQRIQSELPTIDSARRQATESLIVIAIIASRIAAQVRGIDIQCDRCIHRTIAHAQIQGIARIAYTFGRNSQLRAQEFSTELLHLPDARIGSIAANSLIAQADGLAHTSSFTSTAHPLGLTQVNFGTQGTVGIASHQFVKSLQVSSLILRSTTILPLPIIERGQQASIHSVRASSIGIHHLQVKVFDAYLHQGVGSRSRHGFQRTDGPTRQQVIEVVTVVSTLFALLHKRLIAVCRGLDESIDIVGRSQSMSIHFLHKLARCPLANVSWLFVRSQVCSCGNDTPVILPITGIFTRQNRMKNGTVGFICFRSSPLLHLVQACIKTVWSQTLLKSSPTEIGLQQLWRVFFGQCFLADFTCQIHDSLWQTLFLCLLHLLP